MPITTLQSALNERVTVFVEIGENTVLVFEISVASKSLLGSNELWRHKIAIPTQTE